MTGKKLIDSEVAGDDVGTNMFRILFRTYRYPWFARRITVASSSTSIAARRQHVVVLRLSLAMVWLGEHVYGIYEP